MRKLIILSILTFFLSSCDWIACKVSDKVDDMVNNTDIVQPDTEKNRRFFRDILKVSLTNDVTGLYAADDEMGIDYKILMTFRCDTQTVHRIVDRHKMVRSKSAGGGLQFADELPWWHKDKIELLRPYEFGEDTTGVSRRYLWYDSISGRAYYEQFSI